VRLRAGADSLSAEAREAFEKAREKSAVVLARYPESSYADDALLLLGRSLLELGDYGDAGAAFGRLEERFPDSELIARARLGRVRSERLAGDVAAAQAALGALEDDPREGVDPAEVAHERALVELAAGEYDAAAESFAGLLREHPDYARRERVALQFADAELAAGRYDAALRAYSEARDADPDPLHSRALALRMARALALEGRGDEALARYDEILDGGVADSLAARVELERGRLYEGRGEWDRAETSFARVAQLAPGTPDASQATLHRGRIVWHERGDPEQGQEILLDAFLHAPLTAYADSARSEARALERVLHFQRLATGQKPVTGIDDATLARSTALYREAEEVLDAEGGDPARAAELFQQLARDYPGSPWRPRALLSAGLLLRREGRTAEGNVLLDRLVEEYPDHPAADSARRERGLPVPERGPDFYAPDARLTELAGALPAVSDPMIRIADQLDRYRERPKARNARRLEEEPIPDKPFAKRPAEPGSAAAEPHLEGKPGQPDSVGQSGAVEEPREPRPGGVQ